MRNDVFLCFLCGCIETAAGEVTRGPFDACGPMPGVGTAELLHCCPDEGNRKSAARMVVSGKSRVGYDVRVNIRRSRIIRKPDLIADGGIRENCRSLGEHPLESAITGSGVHRDMQVAVEVGHVAL
jgi:hypothetical protein